MSVIKQIRLDASTCRYVTPIATSSAWATLPKDLLASILCLCCMKTQLAGNLPPTSMSCYCWLLITIICIVSSVDRGWNRVINEHSLLLNHLDFSDPYLHHQISERDICGTIKRSGRRLQSFAIWNHFGHFHDKDIYTNWHLGVICTSLASLHVIDTCSRSSSLLLSSSLSSPVSSSSFRLNKFIIHGHQESANAGKHGLLTKTNINHVIKLRPHIIELATCADSV
jgi:hypothetical protein